jgi:hypothetical protein
LSQLARDFIESAKVITDRITLMWILNLFCFRLLFFYWELSINDWFFCCCWCCRSTVKFLFQNIVSKRKQSILRMLVVKREESNSNAIIFFLRCVICLFVCLCLCVCESVWEIVCWDLFKTTKLYRRTRNDTCWNNFKWRLNSSHFWLIDIYIYIVCSGQKQTLSRSS